METIFVEAASRNPALAVQLREHPNPAKFAYEMGKTLKFQNEIGGNPEAYRQKLRTEILEELKVEQAKANGSVQRPNTLADTPNAGNQRNPDWQGPTPLENIIP